MAPHTFPSEPITALPLAPPQHLTLTNNGKAGMNTSPKPWTAVLWLFSRGTPAALLAGHGPALYSTPPPAATGPALHGQTVPQAQRTRGPHQARGPDLYVFHSEFSSGDSST